MKIHLILSTTLLVFLSTIPSDAANIAWGAGAQNVSADTNVNNTGSLLYAFTFGDTAVPSATVNGVTFSPFARPNDATNTPVTVGSVTLASTGIFFVSTNADSSVSAPYSGLSAAYQGLLKSGIGMFGGGMTLTLGGLTNGTSYTVQLWSQDTSDNPSAGFNTASNDAKTTLTAGAAVTLDENSTNATGGIGQWATGTFTATGSTQVIAVTESHGSFEPVLNALQVRTAVPEPASLGLLGLGAALLAGRRRRGVR